MVSDRRKIFLFSSLTVFPIVPISQTASFDHSILELNCLVHGDDPRNIFPVKIASTESVGTLKKAIKEEKKPVFDHVAADALKLWKVSIPVDAEYKENVGEVELGDGAELSPVETLSDVFSPVPTRKHLHIIVVYPLPDGEYECVIISIGSDDLPLLLSLHVVCVVTPGGQKRYADDSFPNELNKKQRRMDSPPGQC
jgi:hypothetical protein